MLELRGLAKTLGARAVIEQVSLSCAPGEVALVSGENGTGKTTLLRIVAGLVAPDQGSVHVCGHCLTRQPTLAKACLGFAPDHLDAAPELLVSELLGLVAALKSRARRAPADIDAGWQRRLGVEPLRGQRLRSLSFGQKKRVALLAALIGEPELLILDEPSNGLDAAGVRTLGELLAARMNAAQATLLTSHDPELCRNLEATRYQLAGGTLVRMSAVGDGRRPSV